VAIRHRREIESFLEVLKRDGVAFVSKTYQVFEVLRRGSVRRKSLYVAYLVERYLDDEPRGDKGVEAMKPLFSPG
jgi:hypothetical protein